MQISCFIEIVDCILPSCDGEVSPFPERTPRSTEELMSRPHPDPHSRRRRPAARAALLAAATVAGLGAVALASTAQAAAGCTVTYRVASQWPGGFVADVNLTNHGAPLSGWTLTWQYTDGQRITS